MTAADIISYIPLMVGGVVLVVGISVGGWVMNTRFRIKHGYPLESMWGMPIHPKTDIETQERMKLVTQENAALRAELGAVKDRLAVVERIVTDKGFDVSRQIEQLRDEHNESQLADSRRDKAVN